MTWLIHIHTHIHTYTDTHTDTDTHTHTHTQGYKKHGTVVPVEGLKTVGRLEKNICIKT